MSNRLKHRHGRRIQTTPADKVFDIFVYLFAAIVIVATLYPLIYVISMSISDPVRAARGEVFLLPKGFSLDAYKTVLANSKVFIYYFNTIWYTVVGTVLGIFVTVLAAYPLSRKSFRYRKVFMIFITITMFFSGGMIPLYIVVTRYLHLYDTRWAVVLPTMTTAWYVIVARSFFQSLPEEVIESAKIDGASEFRILRSIVLPLSKPIIGVLALYFGVSYWNSYFPAMLYLGNQDLHPMSLYVRRMVIQSSMEGVELAEGIAAQDLLSQLQIKYAVIVIAVLPLLLIYPLLSKNLEKGLMIGSVKG